jgi:hypothetical protein
MYRKILRYLFTKNINTNINEQLNITKNVVEKYVFDTPL